MSLLQRKLIQISRQTIKKIHKFSRRGKNQGAPILVNSVPKSGTHLLYQLFSNSNYLYDYNTFIASMPSFTQKEIGISKTLNQISSIMSQELVRGHIFYNKSIDKLINSRKIIHFFIYRDPRDIAISEANYLYDMNKFHSLHKTYKNLHSFEDRILFSILGNEYIKTKTFYPNISERFSMYKKWIESNNILCVKYEDLVVKNNHEEIKRIMMYYIKNANLKNLNINILLKNALNNIDPNKSHTFREGGINKWKIVFTEKHKDVFKAISGELLIDLGYEKDLNW